MSMTNLRAAPRATSRSPIADWDAARASVRTSAAMSVLDAARRCWPGMFGRRPPSLGFPTKLGLEADPVTDLVVGDHPPDPCANEGYVEEADGDRAPAAKL